MHLRPPLGEAQFQVLGTVGVNKTAVLALARGDKYRVHVLLTAGEQEGKSVMGTAESVCLSYFALF